MEGPATKRARVEGQEAGAAAAAASARVPLNQMHKDNKYRHYTPVSKSFGAAPTA